MKNLKTISRKGTLVVLIGAMALMLASCASNNNESITSDATSPNESQNESTTAAIGSRAPNFEFADTDGLTFKLEDYQGDVVLLNFWASWCGPCLSEMPDMQQITEDYSNVHVVAINRGDTTVEEANEAALSLGYDFNWGTDASGVSQELYPSNGIPYSVIIDKDGVIQEIYEGTYPNMYTYFSRAVEATGATKA